MEKKLTNLRGELDLQKVLTDFQVSGLQTTLLYEAIHDKCVILDYVRIICLDLKLFVT